MVFPEGHCEQIGDQSTPPSQNRDILSALDQQDQTHISSTLISDQIIISKGKIETTKDRFAEVGNGEVPKMTFLYIFI